MQLHRFASLLVAAWGSIGKAVRHLDLFESEGWHSPRQHRPGSIAMIFVNAGTIAIPLRVFDQAVLFSAFCVCLCICVRLVSLV